MNLLRSYLVPFCAMLALAGCGGSSSTPIPPPPAIGQIYVTLANEGQLVRFKAGDNGDASPQGRLNVSPAGPTFIAMDVPHNRIAIRSNDGTPAITLIDNVSGPGTAPRVITGVTTTLGIGIGECALDSTRDLLYVAQDFVPLGAGTGVVLVFGPVSTITGNVAPLRSFTLAFHLGGLLLDAANDRLFLSDPVTNAITIFDNASTLSGPVVPARAISGANTQLQNPDELVLDSGRLIVSNPRFLTNPQSSNILVFANANVANGNIAPTASSMMNQLPSEMALSPAGELYVVDGTAQITAYGGVATATGAINPIRVITGPNTGLGFFQPTVLALPLGIAVDSTR
jgi:hypothetical protein